MRNVISLLSSDCSKKLAMQIERENRHTILLYNPISGHGHLDGWNAMVAETMLHLGYSVVCLTPDTEALSSRLQQRGLDRHPELSILPWACTLERSLMGCWRRFKEQAHYRWYVISNTYVNRLEGSRITPDMPFARRCKKRLCQWLVPPAYTVFDFIRRSVTRVRKKYDFLRQAEPDTGFSPHDWGQQIKNALQGRVRPDFLFNMYMDAYQTGSAAWRDFAHICGLPWAGIRFAPWSGPADRPDGVEGWCNVSNWRGMCFLSEQACQEYRVMLPHRVFSCLPDVTSLGLPPSPPDPVRRIQELAADKTVVFLGGSVTHRKSIPLFASLVHTAPSEKWFFVVCGRVYKDEFDKEDLDAFFSLQSRDNVLIFDEFIADEADFNAVINACDIIYAVYKDFPYTSNMLAKSAGFRKALLVAEGGLMERYVRDYQLGVAMPEGDRDAAWGALLTLQEYTVTESSANRYLSDFNEKKMADVLGSFITSCFPEKG